MKGYRLVTPPSSGNELFDLKLFRWSPLGPIVTTLLIGAVAYGLFVLNVWMAEDFAAFWGSERGRSLARVAFVLTLILCAALLVSHFDEQADRRDAAVLAREFGLTVPSHREGSAGLRRASVVGLVAGIVFLGFIVWVNTRGDVLAFASSAGLWFMPMTPLLWMLLARGVYGSFISARYMARLIRDELVIDLYRHHELAIFGLIAMRGAFIWLIFVGIILLSFPEGGSAAFAQPTLAISVAIATFNFVSTMQPIRRKIRAAKDAELKSIRNRLAEARAEMKESGSAGAEVPALVALEGHVEGVSDWPLDLPTAARLPLYILIPVATWAAGVYGESLLARVWGGG